MWKRETGRGVRRDLTRLLLEKDNPYVVANKHSLISRLLDVYEWEPVKIVLRGEVKTYGTQVLGAFKEPSLMDDEMHLEDQLEFLDKEARFNQSAPILFLLLSCCCTPLRSDQRRRKTPWPALTMIVCQLAYLAAPRKFNRLAISLGMLLSHYHLTKHGLDTLNALGITASYKSVNAQTKKLQESHKRTLQTVAKGMKNRIVIWDNLYRVNNVQETRAGDEQEQMNVTTGMIKLCRSIPKGGLRQSLLNWGHNLTVEDIIPVKHQAIRVRRELIDEVRK